MSTESCLEFSIQSLARRAPRGGARAGVEDQPEIFAPSGVICQYTTANTKSSSGDRRGGRTASAQRVETPFEAEMCGS
ncbi:hypothetical protein CR492_13715 [Methylocella silvestris]|uniref:Uncharacterized protein n=1 Tax=Methylocella silvestris TaxID=199596 RepID=A0A2J7TF35_METSI|nr:hypothetical protein CR492_13715 [Methylocella silvestris]